MRREFFNLNAVELVDVQLGEPVNVVKRQMSLRALKLNKDFEFQSAEFAIR